MTEHSVWWNGILVLTAYQYLILAVVDDILVHGICDGEVRNFLVDLEPLPRINSPHHYSPTTTQ